MSACRCGSEPLSSHFLSKAHPALSMTSVKPCAACLKRVAAHCNPCNSSAACMQLICLWCCDLLHALRPALQAAPTDNPPVYILGGNVVPIGANGTNTTAAARAANLTLVAALPGPHSPLFSRCGQGCSAQSSPGNLVACGHMYLDQGTSMFVLGGTQIAAVFWQMQPF